MIGFARDDGMDGSGGIEQYYNPTLRGTNGSEYGYLNDDSNLERVIKPASNGNTVVSTIDTNVQKIVEKLSLIHIFMVIALNAVAGYTLNRKSTTSPSFTTYSFPSIRTRPFSLAAV